MSRSFRIRATRLLAAFILGLTGPLSAAQAAVIIQSANVSDPKSVHAQIDGASLVGINDVNEAIKSERPPEFFRYFEKFDTTLGTLDSVTWSGFARHIVEVENFAACFGVGGIPGVSCYIKTEAKSSQFNHLYLFRGPGFGTITAFDGTDFKTGISANANVGTLATPFACIFSLPSCQSSGSASSSASFSFEDTYLDAYLKPLTPSADFREDSVAMIVNSDLLLQVTTTCRAYAVFGVCQSLSDASSVTDIQVQLTHNYTPFATAVPLPAAGWGLALSLAALAGLRRRRRRF
ncbi:hypothetical protein GCM10011360_26100 [Primorskyibacter flagellatus]|uniref:VPLPA-CTERM protein sorting domain-containing protein n=1 Tax=Primorskyibacter flagellatus TaxID=1387277 RepID=A0A917EGI2_9RHOB|nr:hypothetical protein [Primorskyibacter flagellatus]GGE37085.1 hypothetical protein GCM10011360_26100 [Primorskyibacter flagellatus]